MLTCVPSSFCSWDFRVAGASAGAAALSFQFSSEQGTLTLGGNEMPIRKHGLLSGRWTLERGGQIFAEAHKPNALLRSFDLHAGESVFTVRARSVVTRSYEIVSGDQPLGVIRPVHAFTRRTVVECASSVPEFVQLFAFWLAVITWKRASDGYAAISGL